MNRVRELISRPRLYIRRRSEDVCFEQTNHVRLAGTQTLIIPAVQDDFPEELLQDGVDEYTRLATLLDTHRQDMVDEAKATSSRLVTLGFFPKRPYPSIEAHDGSGALLPVLAMRESARVIGGILMALYEADYGTDPEGKALQGWDTVEPILAKRLNLLLRLPPRRLFHEPKEYAFPSPEGYSEDELTGLLSDLKEVAQGGNGVAENMLELPTPPPQGCRLKVSLDPLTRATHRFAIVRAAVGDRVVVRHRYSEPVSFLERDAESQVPREYMWFAPLGIVPRHLTLRARNHNHVHSFSMTVRAPMGSSLEYLVWAQRQDAARKKWLLEDDVTARGSVAHVRCHNHEDQDFDVQAEVEERSAGNVIAAFQLQQRGLARDASFVGGLLCLLLAVGAVFPDAISDSKGAAASLVLVLPASATALLAQRFPEPVTEDFAHLVRRSMLLVAFIGFAAATLGGIKLVTNPHWIAVLSALGLVVAGAAVGLLVRLGFVKRERTLDWPHPKNPWQIIRSDLTCARRYSVATAAACVGVAGALGLIGVLRT